MLDQNQNHGPPHAILLAAVVISIFILPSMIGEQGEAIFEFISDFLTPVGLLLLPVGLLIVIQLLSGNSALGNTFSGGEPNSIHRASGSPVGVALFLALILCLLYCKVSLFGGGDDDEE